MHITKGKKDKILFIEGGKKSGLIIRLLPKSIKNIKANNEINIVDSLSDIIEIVIKLFANRNI